MRLDAAAIRHSPGDPLGKVDRVLMLGGEGVGGILLGLIRVRHIVDAEADDILRRCRDGAFEGHRVDRQGRDACDGQRQSGPHLRGQKGDRIAQCFVG